MTTKEKYLWLVKHLAWNASKPTGKTFWVKIPKDEASELLQEFPLVTKRLLAGKTEVDVINMLDNNIVLDTRV